ncbi:MAG: hypothetical protein RMJ56_16540 [Gemmataceae bacterium]|nr:hypothetical protein [Gemmataceae bacterium]
MLRENILNMHSGAIVVLRLSTRSLISSVATRRPTDTQKQAKDWEKLGGDTVESSFAGAAHSWSFQVVRLRRSVPTGQDRFRVRRIRGSNPASPGRFFLLFFVFLLAIFLLAIFCVSSCYSLYEKRLTLA